MSEIVDMEFTEATDKISRLYPPALARFKAGLEKAGFTPTESFQLVAIYLKLLVSLVFEQDECSVDEEDDEDDEKEERGFDL
jgi:hypothetical protein